MHQLHVVKSHCCPLGPRFLQRPYSFKSSHLSSFSCDVHVCPRALPSSRKVHCPAKPPASDPDEANGRRVESLPCESRFCPDDTGDKMGSKSLCLRVVLRASLPARRNRAPLTSPVGGGSILGRDLAGAWRRWCSCMRGIECEESLFHVRFRFPARRPRLYACLYRSY
jgi:hypothetical protein